MKMLSVSSGYESEIQNAGYAILPGRFFKIPSHFARNWNTFVKSWELLPQDDSISGADCYRFRRYSRLVCYPHENKIERLPHAGFFQSASNNHLYGGIKREFAPVLPRAINNGALRQLIALNFCHFGISPNYLNPRWFVGVHQIRIFGRRGHPGTPTPEGIHRDGSHFIGMHLVGRRNVRGGYTRIFDQNGNELANTCLTYPLDSIVVDDTRVRHAVTPIQPLDPNEPAVRDMLILTYDTVVDKDARKTGNYRKRKNRLVPSVSVSKLKEQ
jgi:hypothetical protein